MPLENIYEISDRIDLTRLKIAGLLVLLILGWVLFGAWNISRDLREVAAAGTPEADRLRSVDALCTDLPKPEKFYFVNREPPTEVSGRTSVVYRFRSERSPEEIMPAIIVRLGENGWTFKPNSESLLSVFKRANQTIAVSNSESSIDSSAVNYNFYCSEEAAKY